MPFSSATKEKMTSLTQSIEAVHTQLEELMVENETSLWLKDIEEFRQSYLQFAKERQSRVFASKHTRHTSVRSRKRRR